MYRSFKDMPVWKRAMDAAERVHELTESLPKREDFGFTSQVRRSSLSISANIAEAFGRRHALEKINFYFIAKGSLTETLSHLEYGKRVKYFAEYQVVDLEDKLASVYNELEKIILSLKRSKSRGSNK